MQLSNEIFAMHFLFVYFLLSLVVKHKHNAGKREITLLSQLRDTLGLYVSLGLDLFYEFLKCLQGVFLVFGMSWRFDHSHRTNRNEYGWILMHICGLWVQGDSVYRVNLLLPVDGR